MIRLPKKWMTIYIDLQKLFMVNLILLGFLDSCHYNSPTLEECHYFSRYLKLAIKILQSSQTCPDLRLLRLWAHCQGAFLRMRTVLPLLFFFKPSGRLEPTRLASSSPDSSSPFFSRTPLPSRPASPRRVRRRRPPRFGGCLVEDEFEADLAAAVHRLQLDTEAGSKPAAARTCGLPWLPHRAGSDRQQAAENLWAKLREVP